MSRYGLPRSKSGYSCQNPYYTGFLRTTPSSFREGGDINLLDSRMGTGYRLISDNLSVL